MRKIAAKKRVYQTEVYEKFPSLRFLGTDLFIALRNLLIVGEIFT